MEYNNSLLAFHSNCMPELCCWNIKNTKIHSGFLSIFSFILVHSLHGEQKTFFSRIYAKWRMIIIQNFFSTFNHWSIKEPYWPHFYSLSFDVWGFTYFIFVLWIFVECSNKCRIAQIISIILINLIEYFHWIDLISLWLASTFVRRFAVDCQQSISIYKNFIQFVVDI